MRKKSKENKRSFEKIGMIPGQLGMAVLLWSLGLALAGCGKDSAKEQVSAEIIDVAERNGSTDIGAALNLKEDKKKNGNEKSDGTKTETGKIDEEEKKNESNKIDEKDKKDEEDKKDRSEKKDGEDKKDESEKIGGEGKKDKNGKISEEEKKTDNEKIEGNEKKDESGKTSGEGKKDGGGKRSEEGKKDESGKRSEEEKRNETGKKDGNENIEGSEKNNENSKVPEDEIKTENKTEEPTPHECLWDKSNVATQVDCVNDGVIYVSCSVCGNQKTEIIPKWGHDLQESWWEQPNCTYAGSGHGMYCSRCDYWEELANGALGHLPDEGVMWKAPDCVHEGYISHVCIRCQANLEDTVVPADPNAHVWHEDEMGWYCGLCSATK